MYICILVGIIFIGSTRNKEVLPSMEDWGTPKLFSDNPIYSKSNSPQMKKISLINLDRLLSFINVKNLTTHLNFFNKKHKTKRNEWPFVMLTLKMPPENSEGAFKHTLMDFPHVFYITQLWLVRPYIEKVSEMFPKKKICYYREKILHAMAVLLNLCFSTGASLHNFHVDLAPSFIWKIGRGSGGFSTLSSGWLRLRRWKSENNVGSD